MKPYLILALLLLTACQKTEPPAEAATADAAKSAPKEEPGQLFGAPLTETEGKTLAQVAADFEGLKGKKLRLDGTVQNMCTHKGNWIAWKDGKLQVLIQFKDRAFKMPPTTLGKRVQAEGYLLDKQLPSGCDENADQSAPPASLDPHQGGRVFFVATGVKVLEG